MRSLFSTMKPFKRVNLNFPRRYLTMIMKVRTRAVVTSANWDPKLDQMSHFRRGQRSPPNFQWVIYHKLLHTVLTWFKVGQIWTQIRKLILKKRLLSLPNQKIRCKLIILGLWVNLFRKDRLWLETLKKIISAQKMYSKRVWVPIMQSQAP